MAETNSGNTPSDLVLDDVQIEISVCLGHAHATMAELSRLTTDDVLTLGGSLDDSVSLYVGKRLIAEGVLEELTADINNELGVRITDVIQRREG